MSCAAVTSQNCEIPSLRTALLVRTRSPVRVISDLSGYPGRKKPNGASISDVHKFFQFRHFRDSWNIHYFVRYSTITPLLVDIINGIALDFFVSVQVESRHCIKENKKNRFSPTHDLAVSKPIPAILTRTVADKRWISQRRLFLFRFSSQQQLSGLRVSFQME